MNRRGNGAPGMTRGAQVRAGSMEVSTHPVLGHRIPCIGEGIVVGGGGSLCCTINCGIRGRRQAGLTRRGPKLLWVFHYRACD